jgi:hypothetical protein
MTRLRSLPVAVPALLSVLAVARFAAADSRAEAGARDAIEKAASDYEEKEFATGAARLQAAARECGDTGCSAETKALVLRDLGVMQLLTDDKEGAVSSFAGALALKPGLVPNPQYDTPEVRAAWDDAKEVALASGGAEQPAGGDFKHKPVREQSVNAPVPIYVRYVGPGTVARVVVKYKTSPKRDWRRLELKRVGAGWGGLVPCDEADVGVLRYWVQGFDASGDPVGTSGDPQHPYIVPMREEITGDKPHLPEMPPATCEEARCAPDDPTCGKSEAPASASASTPEPPSGTKRTSRFWVGLSGTIEFLSLPSGSDLCKLNADGKPANPSNLYCTTPDGTDFPSRASPQQSNSLVAGKAGQSGGGLHAGDFRLMLTADYALLPSLLVGGRLGYTFGTYPGQFASHDGRAFGSTLYVEARATYLFGDSPLSREGWVPIAFAGTGLGEFDGSSSSTATYVTPAGMNFTQPVNIWKTDGPWFLDVGGGARYQLPIGVAVTGALRINLVAGAGGVLVTLGPELGAQYAF